MRMQLYVKIVEEIILVSIDYFRTENYVRISLKQCIKEVRLLPMKKLHWHLWKSNIEVNVHLL